MNRLILRSLIAFVVGLPWSICLYSTEIPNIITFEVDGWAVDGKGFNLDMMQEVGKVLNQKIEVTVKPLGRSVQDYKFKLHDCFIGGDSLAVKTYLELSESQLKKFVFSEAYMRLDYHMFTLKKDPVISDWKQIRGKTVGVALGGDSSFLNPKENNIDLVSPKSIAALIRMLNLGRIDMIMESLPNVSKLLNEVHFKEEFRLRSHYEMLHCHKNAKNISFISEFNRALKQLKDNGTIGQLKKKNFKVY